jgi:NADPH:quinone reductase-like Zn-dependent oxidoreductase
MKAIVHDRYGPPEVLHLEDVPRPVPADDEILVRIHATTVSRSDCGLRAAHPFFARLITGIRRPKQRILGMEFAGEVAEVGAGVTAFRVGDRAFGARGSGAHAEYIAIRESGPVAEMPSKMSFEEAAAVCDGVSLALPCLRGGNVGAGTSILVYGASGAMGTAAVQLAAAFGAEVTAVCGPNAVELVRSLGAGRVIDYTAEDFTREGVQYDVIFDAVGKHSFRRSRRSLKSGGVFLETDLGFGWHVPWLILWTRFFGDKQVKIGIARFSKADLAMLKQLIEEGRFRAVIDRRYPMEQVVEATRYVETGTKIGNVVLLVS